MVCVLIYTSLEYSGVYLDIHFTAMVVCILTYTSLKVMCILTYIGSTVVCVLTYTSLDYSGALLSGTIKVD